MSENQQQINGDDLTKKIQTAIARFSPRSVHRQLMLASSPDAAKKIAESLPGVKDLVEIGPPAGQAALDLLNQEGVKDNELVTIALYLLWKIPTPTATDSLTRSISARQFTGINAELAAEVFLDSIGTDVAEREDRVADALREAKKRINNQKSQD
ncbi:MAG TPA: hypothetical protein VL866_07485 [Pyrinomonadaceae bacterium]|nr:hypothetical protein [Pyrinomonadaceae bacterium]